MSIVAKRSPILATAEHLLLLSLYVLNYFNLYVSWHYFYNKYISEVIFGRVRGIFSQQLAGVLASKVFILQDECISCKMPLVERIFSVCWLKAD